MAINLLGTWEQEENRAGTRGNGCASDILGNREHRNRKHTYRERGKTRKSLLRSREHGTNLIIQWNLDLTKCQGTGPIGSLYRGLVISKTSL